MTRSQVRILPGAHTVEDATVVAERLVSPEISSMEAWRWRAGAPMECRLDDAVFDIPSAEGGG